MITFLSPFLTAFLASLVECIEALTVILAAGAVLGWRGSLAGTAIALATLIVALVAFGPLLTLVPTRVLHLLIGTFLLLFGARWLRKAIYRAAGVIPKRDETASYERHVRRFREPSIHQREAFFATFQVTLIEGLEVVAIVLALGRGDRTSWIPAIAGALAALGLVAGLGSILRKPIERVPQNALKFAVGVASCAFGIFWVGEGFSIPWPGEEWSLLAIVVVLLCLCWGAQRVVGQRPVAGRP